MNDSERIAELESQMEIVSGLLVEVFDRLNLLDAVLGSPIAIAVENNQEKT